jgi:hypothetical protein
VAQQIIAYQIKLKRKESIKSYTPSQESHRGTQTLLIEEVTKGEEVIGINASKRINSAYELLEKPTLFGRADEKTEIIDELLNLNSYEVFIFI